MPAPFVQSATYAHHPYRTQWSRHDDSNEKALEDELGVILLDRSKKPVIPTEAGAVVIAQAQETLRNYNYIKEINAQRGIK